jgi:hypothetical protein
MYEVAVNKAKGMNTKMKANIDMKYIYSTIIGFLVVLFSYFTQKNFFTHDNSQFQWILFSKIVLFLVIFFFTFFIQRRIEYYRKNGFQKSDRVFYVFFFGFSLWFMFWLIGLWPGFLMTDTYATLYQVKILSFDSWFSYLHPLMYLILYYIFPSPIIIPIFQILLTSFIFAWILKLIYKKGVLLWIILIFIVILGISIPIIVNTIFYTRDTIFGLLHLWIAVYLFDILLEKKYSQLARINKILLWSVLIFLSIYRSDGFPLLLLIPLLLIITKQIDTKQVLNLILSVSLIFFVTSVVIPKILKVHNLNKSYGLTLIMNPLGYIIQNDYFSRDKDRDRVIMSKVLDVEKVKQLSNPYEIPAYWARAWKPETAEADYANLNSLFIELTKNNLPLFISNRIYCFSASTSLNDKGFLYVDIREKDSGAEVHNIPTTSLFFKNFTPKLYNCLSNLLNSTTIYKGAILSGRFLYWNFMPHLLIIILTMLLYPYIPCTAASSLIIFYRVPILFLTAPASQFKYFYSLYLFGFFVILLALIEFKNKRKPKTYNEIK